MVNKAAGDERKSACQPRNYANVDGSRKDLRRAAIGPMNPVDSLGVLA
jgi:hypothetical protein